MSKKYNIIKGEFKDLEQNIKEIQTSLINSANTLTKIKATLHQYIEFKNSLVKELNSSARSTSCRHCSIEAIFQLR